MSGPAPTMATSGTMIQPHGAPCVAGASGAKVRGPLVKVAGSAGQGSYVPHPGKGRVRHRYAR
jgi:hypothetical protein